MAPGISYDESGSLASYFGVTFLAIILIPWTLSATRSKSKETLQPLCPCPACRSSPRRIHSIKYTKRKRRFLKKAIPLFIGWALFAYLCYSLSQAPRLEGETIYNPFEILGLSDSSNEKQIKKHYKKLSLQFHPDKIRLSENQTKEDAEQKFVELTKAYKSLTDEVTRENLAKYGNPDGPQQREDKIAIPQWVVEGKNSIWVLGAYGLVLGGGIPWVVGRWWFAQRKLTRDGILNPTAEIFFHQLREDTDFFSLISLLASALEFSAVLGGSKKRGSKKERKERQSKIDELEKILDERKAEMGIEESPLMKKENKVNVTTAVAKRARALLWAHLLRIDLNDHHLESEKLAVLRVTPPLLNALLNISLAHNWLTTSLLCIKLQPALVQALPTDVSPLAQLPGITPEKGTELQIVNKAEGVRWLEKWIKTEKKDVSQETLDVAKYWPRLEVVDAEFKVAGESLVTPSSIVELTFNLRYVYPTTPLSLLAKPKARLPNGEIKEEGAADSVADVEESVTKVEEEKEKPTAVDVKEKIVEKVEEKTEVDGEVKAKKKVEGPPNGFAHAPYWPQLRKPHFYVLLGDSKLDKVIVPPIKITDIPLPEPDGTPSAPKEFKLQFQAPPAANLYSFVAHWRSDTFLGGDVQVPIMLKVEDTPEMAELQEDDMDDDDISEPDEDTLAGQMAMMRGEKVKPSGVHDQGDDDSEEEEDSSSDEEGPKKRVRAYNEDSDTDSD
ncbi:hypothetical protein I302_102298 [Kwoniella bestiolae CBS 10118]|uniref:Translocation protein SEC63 n=1 Tax=Kwoniella bestiolae CBS 10118 TaxID=1296100 RepID=A0A1B9GEN1_9TREE|nr:translocation protein SEC63 [Kwoniella bestiolae CBS 10118]OCF29484.1 translocation protein SEC63 [Kwoniella bestiolae CBS 10118]